MNSQNNAPHLRHEIDNALLAIDALIDDIKDESTSPQEREESLKDIAEYSKKLQKCWSEYKKLSR